MKIEIGQANNYEKTISDRQTRFTSFCENFRSKDSSEIKSIRKTEKSIFLINTLTFDHEIGPEKEFIKQVKGVFIFFPKLKNIPDDCMSSNLLVLHLQNCHHLEKLPNQLPESLVYLNLAGCNKLEQLPDNLLKIKYLNLDGCNSLKLDNIEKLISLKLANLGEQNFALILPNHLQEQFQEKLKEKTKNDGNIPASPAYLHQSREPERSSISDSIDSVNVASIILSQSRFPSRESNSSSASSLLPDSKRRKIDNR